MTLESIADATFRLTISQRKTRFRSEIRTFEKKNCGWLLKRIDLADLDVEALAALADREALGRVALVEVRVGLEAVLGAAGELERNLPAFVPRLFPGSLLKRFAES